MNTKNVLLTVELIRSNYTELTLRLSVHEGGGPYIGEVTCLYMKFSNPTSSEYSFSGLLNRCSLSAYMYLQ